MPEPETATSGVKEGENGKRDEKEAQKRWNAEIEELRPEHPRVKEELRTAQAENEELQKKYERRGWGMRVAVKFPDQHALAGRELLSLPSANGGKSMDVNGTSEIGMSLVLVFLATFVSFLFLIAIIYTYRRKRAPSPATSSHPQDKARTLAVSGCKVHLPTRLRLAQADASIAVDAHCDGLPIDFIPISPVLSCAITHFPHASLEGIEVEMETWATSMEAGVQAYIFRRQPGEEWQLIETASLPTAKRTITFKPAHFSDFVIAVRCTLAMWGVLNCYIDHYLYYNEKGVFTSLTCVSCTKFFEEVNAMKKTEVAEVHHSKGANNETLSFSLRAQEPGDFKFKTDEGCKKDIRVEHLVQEIMKRYQLKRSYAAVIPGSFEGDAQMFFRLSIGDTTLASTPVKVSWPIKIKEAKGSAGQIVIGTMVTGRSTMALTQYDSLSITGATNQRIEPVDESSTCHGLLYLAIAMMGIFVAVFAYWFRYEFSYGGYPL